MSLPFIISFEGLDGSFKETNANKAVSVLESSGFTVKKFDFPQYDSDSSYFIRELLNGSYKNFSDPNIISIMYSLDRFDTWNKKIKQYYTSDSGVDFIIFDRWTCSNIFYQCARMPFKWMATLSDIIGNEQHSMRLPRENLMVYLNLPYNVAVDIMKKDRGIDKMDENEKNMKFLHDVFSMAPNVIKELKLRGYNIEDVECAYLNDTRSRDDIWRDVYMAIQPLMKERMKIKNGII